MSGRIVGPDGRRISAMPAAQWAGQMLHSSDADPCCAEAIPIEHAGGMWATVTYHRNPDATVLSTNEACGITGRSYSQLEADYPVGCAPLAHSWANRGLGNFFAQPIGCSGHRDEAAWELPCGHVHDCQRWWAPYYACAYVWYGTVTVGGMTYHRRLFATSSHVVVWFPGGRTPREQEYRDRCCPSAAGYYNNRTLSASSTWERAMNNKDPNEDGIEVGRIDLTCVINGERDRPTLPKFGAFIRDYGCITKVHRVIEQQSVEGYSTRPGTWADALVHNIGYIGGTENYTVETAAGGTGTNSFTTPEVEREAWVSGYSVRDEDGPWGGCGSWCYLEEHGTAPCCSRWLSDPGPPPEYRTGECLFCIRKTQWDMCRTVMMRQHEMTCAIWGSIT